MFLDTMFRRMDNPTTKEKYENIVIITHGLLMRIFLMRYFKWDVEQFNNISQPDNCEMFILKKQSDTQYKSGNYKLKNSKIIMGNASRLKLNKQLTSFEIFNYQSR